MCELGVFPTFSENDLLKVDKILGLTSAFSNKKILAQKSKFIYDKQI